MKSSPVKHQPELEMTERFKEELSISSRVEQLVRRESAERESAEDKRTSVKGKFLPSLITLFSDQVDGFNFPEAVFGNINSRKE